MMVMQPLLVTSTTLSIMFLVPLAKFSHSNTPTGPFHTICLALLTASAKSLELSGPQSKPWKGQRQFFPFICLFCFFFKFNSNHYSYRPQMTSAFKVNNLPSILPECHQPLQLFLSWPSHRTFRQSRSQREAWSWLRSSQLWPSGHWRFWILPHQTRKCRSVVIKEKNEYMQINKEMRRGEHPPHHNPGISWCTNENPSFSFLLSRDHRHGFYLFTREVLQIPRSKFTKIRLLWSQSTFY